jgi:hypothetical protein
MKAKRSFQPCEAKQTAFLGCYPVGRELLLLLSVGNE